MTRATAVLSCALVAGATPALADHDHHMGHDHDGHTAAVAPRTKIVAELGLVAAGYSNTLYEGDYQGITAAGGVERGRFGAKVGIAGYRLTRNGLAENGVGDVNVQLSMTLVTQRVWSSGVMVMGSLPTGASNAGFGMGHVMLMGHGWASVMVGDTMLTGMAGYGRALAGMNAHAHHGGGAWPLVDPMTISEILTGVGIERHLTSAIGAGARTSIAIPLSDGDTRVILTTRLGWTRGRYATGAELQAGLTGEPFDLRGLMTTSASF